MQRAPTSFGYANIMLAFCKILLFIKRQGEQQFGKLEKFADLALFGQLSKVRCRAPVQVDCTRIEESGRLLGQPAKYA